MLRFSVLFVLFLGSFDLSVDGWLWSKEQFWTGLRLPWSLKGIVMPSKGFLPVPRDMNNDVMEGYALQSSWCGNDMKFRGHRYWKNNDPTFMLLFDSNGYIAGIQYAIDSEHLTPSQPLLGHPVILDTIGDKTYNVITVYFVDPSIICTGRSSSNFTSQGTGYKFLIQNGNTADAVNLVNIPLTETELQTNNPEWIGPKCFRTMGNHYWLNIQPDMNCENFFPICLLYNGGKLTAFCYGTNANWDDKYVDNPHPSAAVLSNFFKTGHVPRCFKENKAYQQLTTMHVYMMDNPRLGSMC